MVLWDMRDEFLSLVDTFDGFLIGAATESKTDLRPLNRNRPDALD
jgi:hypothetical protein